jgi:hypothetical protein
MKKIVLASVAALAALTLSAFYAAGVASDRQEPVHYIPMVTAAETTLPDWVIQLRIVNAVPADDTVYSYLLHGDELMFVSQAECEKFVKTDPQFLTTLADFMKGVSPKAEAKVTCVESTD